MLRKVREIEGQKSLKHFLTSECKEVTTEPNVTPIHPQSAERRTLPSAEEDPIVKKPNLDTDNKRIETPNKNLLPDLNTPDSSSNMSNMEDKSNNHNEEETEELSQKTILCMKRAMQELITPIEEKLNQLFDTKQLQEVQAIEINKLKKTESELYRRCLKVEIENDKPKKNA